MDFIEELKWRGLYFDMIPGTDELLKKEKARGYIGFDPTSKSLGIGNLVQIILLMHLQRAGHQPVAVVGGATGMVGDPSGKSEERNLMTEEMTRSNAESVRKQLSKFLDFDSKENPAILVDNYDWYKGMNVLEFLRNIGKHLTVNYMMAKDSVKSRLETGISFTEFSYQLLQAYDFCYLYKNHGCNLQMGGSDQWGNIVSGVELIRRMEGGEAYAVTSPLITKSDGTKFGKTESGNIFLDRSLTSPYTFYQFWLNSSDEDAERYIKIFTFLSKEEIEALIEEHRQAPHQRALQQKLAHEATAMVHSEEDYQTAVKASQILFGKSTKDDLNSLDEETFLEVFKGVPQSTVSRDKLSGGIELFEFMADDTGIFPSRGEVRRMVKDGGLSINKEKVSGPDRMVTGEDLLNDRYVLVQKGRKKYFLVIVD